MEAGLGMGVLKLDTRALYKNPAFGASPKGNILPFHPALSTGDHFLRMMQNHLSLLQ